jgi:hypothetical protein
MNQGTLGGLAVGLHINHITDSQIMIYQPAGYYSVPVQLFTGYILYVTQAFGFHRNRYFLSCQIGMRGCRVPVSDLIRWNLQPPKNLIFSNPTRSSSSPL